MPKFDLKFRKDSASNSTQLKRRKLRESDFREDSKCPPVDLRTGPVCLLVQDTANHAVRVMYERFDDGPQYI